MGKGEKERLKGKKGKGEEGRKEPPSKNMVSDSNRRLRTHTCQTVQQIHKKSK